MVEGEYLVLRASARSELRHNEGAVRLLLGKEGITGLVAAQGQPLIVPDTALDPRYVAGDPKARTRSELAVPIRLGHKVIGVIDAQHDTPGAFSQRDISPLQTIADQVAVAMENARLYAAARRELEERRAAEERFGNLAEQSPNIIFLNVGGKVVYANRRCEQIVGYTQEEITSPDFSFMSLIGAESADRVRDALTRHGRGEEVPPYECVVVTRDRRRLHTLIATRLVSYGEVRGILGTITDISQRKRTERLLYALNAAALAMEKVLTPLEVYPAAGEALKQSGLETTVTRRDGEG